MNSKIQESELLKFSFKAMGSDCEFILCLTTKSDSHSVFSSLRDELERLEQKYSKFREKICSLQLTSQQAKVKLFK